MRHSPNNTTGRNPARRHRRPRKRAFTLIELLVIVTIIVVLVGILGPASSAAFRLITSAMSKTRISMIEMGIEAYRADFSEYPPSDPNIKIKSGGTEKKLASGAAICKFVLCGDQGAGFQVLSRSPVRGPYGGTDDLPTTSGKFADWWNQPILYYKYDRASKKYYTEDNKSDQPDIVAYAQRNNIWPRTDYLLISKGSDSLWQNDPNAVRADDITNFTFAK